jgi:hypothetical protein
MNADVWKMGPNASPEKVDTIVVMEPMVTTATPVEGLACQMVRNVMSMKIVTCAAARTTFGIQLVNIIVVPSLVTRMGNHVSLPRVVAIVVVEVPLMVMVQLAEASIRRNLNQI